MAEITYQTLRDFVINHGILKIVDLTGKTRMLQPDVPDVWDMAEKATSFEYDGKWYTREGFSKLMDELSAG